MTTSEDADTARQMLVEAGLYTRVETYVGPANIGVNKEWWRKDDGRLVLRTRNFLEVD